MIEFYAEGRPAPQGSLSRGRGRSLYHASPNLGEWREAVARAARDHKAAHGPILGPVTLDLLFEIRRPLGHYRGRQAGNGLTLAAIGAYPHRPDLSKLIRSTEDALVMGALIGDDSQIIEVKARKVYSSAQGVRVKLDAVFP